MAVLVHKEQLLWGIELANSGIFSVNDINDLINNQQYPKIGELQHIQTQTFSEVYNLNFMEIQEEYYDVHFMTFNRVNGYSAINSGIQFYEDGVLETANVYQDASQYGTTGGSFGESKSTARNRIYLHNYGNQQPTGGYAYFYNLGDSTKYSFCTWHSIQAFTSSGTMFFGSGVMTQASKVNGIKIYIDSISMSGSISLYGIRYS